MQQHVERWKRMMADNNSLAERLESGEIRAFSGPSSAPGSDVSSSLAARLRQINADLQRLIDRHGQRDPDEVILFDESSDDVGGNDRTDPSV
jgi:hypothetical protein